MSLVELHNVGIEFPIYGMSSTSLKRQLLRITTGGVLGKTQHNDFVIVRALKNIHLSLKPGDRLGLIGHNGAGKSTLLRVLAKIYEPTVGHAHVRGKVSALLDVMMGMDHESTGYENIIMRGLLHGLTRREIEAKKADIAEFTELGDFLAMPVRTYSSGMVLRLAFAIATSVVPEVLVIDEVIGAGDAAFMKKSEERLHAMIKNSQVGILSSHDTNVIEKHCTSLAVLNAGEMTYLGPVEKGLAFYEASITQS